MSFKKIGLLLLAVFILTSSTSIIFAEEVKVSDISFEVPGNYSINKTTDDLCLLKGNNENYTISVILSEDSNPDIEKASRINSGFNFLAEENYTSDNNINVIQQNFIKNESFFSFYTFDVDNSSYMIIFTFPVDDELDATDSNPVNEIIDSIH